MTTEIPVEKPVQPFELKVGGEDGIDNADVPVRWCITTEFVDKIEEDGIVDPHILLVSFNPKTNQEISRHLSPLAELMTYVRFHQSGPMKIFGWIIDGKEGRKVIDKHFLQRTKGHWNTFLLECTDEYNSDHGYYPLVPRQDIEHTYIGTEVDVEIPANVFGDEPKPWLKWFVNLWHSSTPRDECDFRKRLGIAVLVKWEVMLVFMAFSIFVNGVITGLLSLCGFYNTIRWKAFLHPFDWGFFSFLRDEYFETPKDFFGNQRFIITKEVDSTTVFFVAPLMFTPIVPLVIFLISWATHESVTDAVVATSMFFSVMVMIGMLFDLIIQVAWFIVRHFEPTITRLLDFFENKWQAFDQYLTQRDLGPTFMFSLIGFSVIVTLTVLIVFWTYLKLVVGSALLIGAIAYGYYKLMDAMFVFGHLGPEQNDPTEIRELLCPKDGMNLQASWSYIPKEQRSFRLWFRTLKNKVCRPMQQ